MNKENNNKLASQTIPLFSNNGRDEMNLAEFPFALLSGKSTIAKTLYYTDTIRGKGGEAVTRKWTVTASDKYGMPTRDDEIIYIGLMQITKDNGFEDPRQFFSRYRLLKLISWPDTGPYYNRIEQSLDRLMGVVIKAENAFYDLKRRAYCTESFHIIDNYRLWDRTDRAGDGQHSLPMSYFKWNEIIWKSITNGYIKNLDTKFWFSLESAIARRLHRYLDKKFYKKDLFQIGLKLLAFEKLGMSRTYTKPFKIKSLLNPACDELVARGYLKNYSYQDGRNGDLIVSFTRATGVKQEQFTFSENESALKAQLIERGITKATAGALIKQYAAARIKQKIELFEYLKSTGSQLLSKNPAGYLRKAIEEDYAPPKDFKTGAEREEMAVQERNRELQRKLRDKESQFQTWVKATNEQKIYADLMFWKIRYKKEHGQEPGPAEIEVKRHRLLQNIPSPEEYRHSLFKDLDPAP